METKSSKVTIETSLGTVIVKLNPEKAPISTDNFLSYVKDGTYDGTIFHRVIKGFMAQGGGFSTEYQKKSTKKPIQNEADNGLENKRGTLAMARTSEPHSATSQFFINLIDNPFLNFTNKKRGGWGYTVFGEVIEGMDVVDKMATIPTGPGGTMQRDVPQTPIVINKVTILTE